MAHAYARSRRRWTMEDVVAAQTRLERVGLTAAPVIKAVEPQPAELKSAFDYAPFGGFSFTLPWAPSVNAAYANKKVGGRVKTKKATRFAEACGVSLLAQGIPCRYLAHPLAIHITQHRRTARGDIDNGLKVVLDALVKYGVIADDNRGIVKRVCIEDGERVEHDEYIEVAIACV
jgi:Holliday junction resolvase RusA-like endonuclease